MIGVSTLAAVFALAAAPGGDLTDRLPEMRPARSIPSGFVQMFVATVMPTPDGHTVVLVSPEEEVLLPVGVALPEAVAIFGRLEHKQAPKPLTHDLLDGVMKALDGTVVKVQIDDLKDGAFVGTVTLRKKSGGDVTLDARVADALAVALSAKAPIFVARPVVDRAALTHDDLKDMPARGTSHDEGDEKVFEL